MTVASALFAGVVYGSEITAMRVVFTAGILLVSTSMVHFQNLRNDLSYPPGNWNYNLYLGALWVRDQLPEDATIWAGSAGILGYFSNRTVVNIDGLANDYDFLENYLEPGKRVDYNRKWQYGIDAFPESWTLDWVSPDGCYQRRLHNTQSRMASLSADWASIRWIVRGKWIVSLLVFPLTLKQRTYSLLQAPFH